MPPRHSGAAGKPTPSRGPALVCSVSDHLGRRCACFADREHLPCVEHDGAHCGLCEKPWPCPES